MAFHITHRYGDDESDPPLTSLVGLLRELDDRLEDTEHASVSVTHESEWCISVGRGGYVIFENLESEGGGERHMRNVSDRKILELWSFLAVGDLQRLELEPWKPGYG
jgi:hypothetical protein